MTFKKVVGIIFYLYRPTVSSENEFTMKNVIIALTAIFFMAACNNKKTDTRDIELLTDSTAYNNDMYSDTSSYYETQQELAPVTPVKSVTTRSSGTSRSSAGTSTRSSGTTSRSTGTTQTAQHKKGWSSAAKGAVIGAGAGAIGGAVISKKKPVKGAVIGAAVGAAGGYIIGKDIDKRNGR